MCIKMNGLGRTSNKAPRPPTEKQSLIDSLERVVRGHKGDHLGERGRAPEGRRLFIQWNVPGKQKEQIKSCNLFQYDEAISFVGNLVLVTM